MQIEPGRTFVRYHPEGVDGRSFLAVVIGELGEGGSIFLICVFQDLCVLEVPRETCTVLSLDTIRRGLVGLIARGEGFGIGNITAEESTEGLLHVVLKNGDRCSEPIPLTRITICCPSTTHA